MQLTKYTLVVGIGGPVKEKIELYGKMGERIDSRYLLCF